jgi:hypothetical protein
MNLPVTSALLRRLVRCVRLQLPPSHAARHDETRRELAFDNASLAWLERLSSVPEELRTAVALDAPASAGLHLTVPGLTAAIAMRRLITIARRAGFEETDTIRQYLFTTELETSSQTAITLLEDLTLPRTPQQMRGWIREGGGGAYDGQMTESLLAQVRITALQGWKERAIERGQLEPLDLSSSCKFSSALVRTLFGGTIEGTHEHQFNRIAGAIVDINRDAQDVSALRARGIDPHQHDRRFIGSRDHIDSMLSCMPRVRVWATRSLDVLRHQPSSLDTDEHSNSLRKTRP